MNLKNCFLILALLFGTAVLGQSTQRKDTATVNKLLAQSKSFVATDSAKAMNLALQAKEMASELKFSKGEAYALKAIGMVYYLRAKYGETLDYWSQSLQIFENIEDDIGSSNMLNNIGAVYLNQGADAKALEYMLRSLKLAEKIGDTLRIITALSNIGSTYYNKKDTVALNYFLKAIPLVERTGHIEEYVGITGNIGEIYANKNEDEKALEYFQRSIKAAGNNFTSAFSVNGIGRVYLKEGKFSEALELHNQALENARKFDDQLEVVHSLQGIANAYLKLNNANLALEYYNKARVIAEGIDDLKIELQKIYRDMSTAYAKNNDFSNAYTYNTRYAAIKDTLYNLETKKKLNQLQFDFDISKKEQEIVLKEAKIKSEKQARILMTIGLVLLLVIAFIIYRNYLQKAKTNKILDKQKAQIEQLLLNILPEEVATELQTSGHSKPRHFDEVSVLFTDFKGFTSIADKLSPEAVVRELNECFMAFDNIMGKYELEKIKTIGDAYMCAGNIPTPDADHVYKIIRAAKEIQAFMEQHNGRRAEMGMETWEIRIGVHVGPVVAGVVGKKKYAYDIWGSTVNIASRMESNGTPGKVNVSATTYEKIKDQFDCSYRGKISAKNLGELDMYFVDGEKPWPHSNLTRNHVQEGQFDVQIDSL